MTAHDFITSNKDILLHRVEPDELGHITEGCPLFLLITRSGKTPLEQRPISAAHYAICAGNPDTQAARVVTAARNTQCYSIHPEDIQGPYATKILFLAVPLDHKDRRRNKPWQEWPQP